MNRTFYTPKVVLIATAVAILSFFASIALANSDTNSENPDLLVSVSLSSDNEGAGPDAATVGNKVVEMVSIMNLTRHYQGVAVTHTRSIGGQEITSESKTVIMAPGQTFTRADRHSVGSSFPLGTLVSTVTVTGTDGTSSATAAIEIIEPQPAQ